MILLNPTSPDYSGYDSATRDLLESTIRFFESKGKRKIKEHDRGRVWYQDLLDFQKDAGLFATFLTPSRYGGENARWDTWRNCALNEVLGFYGLHYWYTWQVSILGLGPIWMSDNEAAKEKAARLLREGEVFAFGLSERDHGADIYSTEMALEPRPDGSYRANGAKYYIGNGNVAPMVSTLGKLTDSGDWVFFAADYRKESYECVRNVVNSQSYVSEFALHDYPVAEEDVLSRGPLAWDTALNTVNVGKYNLGWASIGICTHSLYEAIHHAAHRRLYGMAVTDFPHVKSLFVDAWCRLLAMKLFALRASDYQRVASPEDRRYLLFNPVVKMKVTTQGEEVINLLWDVIAAKGFERDTYFEMAARDIRALPKLEGTVHVNVALIVKFLESYFFRPADFPHVGRQDQVADDEFLFRQGPTKGLSKVRFHDFRKAFEALDLPNVEVFQEQIGEFQRLLMEATPSEDQKKDPDLLLAVGEIFTLVVYAQLIAENAKIYEIPSWVVDQIFHCLVRDFSRFALAAYSKPSVTDQQVALLQGMIRRPVFDAAQYDRVWQEQVFALRDAYELQP